MQNATAVKVTPLIFRQHVMVAELETDYGFRVWTEPMTQRKLDEFLATQRLGEESWLSDYCCSTGCWCVEA